MPAPIRQVLHHGRAWLFALILGALYAGTASAAAFEVAVAPTRVTAPGAAGQRLGQALKVYNLGNQSTSLSFRTLDWTLSEAGELQLQEELKPDSCRPWVALERRTRQIAARSDTSFRFQVNIPADAPRGECRFMIAVEGVEPAHMTQINSGAASVNLPIAGRIAVAVYIAIGGAQPKLELQQIGTDSLRKDRKPMVRIHNSGDAHGRLDGALQAQGPDGKAFELVPDGGPILPGQTRTLRLSASGKAPALSYPMNVEGTIDWDDGAFKFKATLP